MVVGPALINDMSFLNHMTFKNSYQNSKWKIVSNICKFVALFRSAKINNNHFFCSSLSTYCQPSTITHNKKLPLLYSPASGQGYEISPARRRGAHQHTGFQGSYDLWLAIYLWALWHGKSPRSFHFERNFGREQQKRKDIPSCFTTCTACSVQNLLS